MSAKHPELSKCAGEHSGPCCSKFVALAAIQSIMLVALIVLAAAPVTVRVESPRPVTLNRETEGREWSYGPVFGYPLRERERVVTKLCDSPCARAIDRPETDFFIDGKGVVPSDHFTLKGRANATLSVSPGDSRVRTASYVVALASGATLLVALISLAADLSAHAALRPLTVSTLVTYPVLLVASVLLERFSDTTVTVR
jgi:hypothetical protein